MDKCTETVLKLFDTLGGSATYMTVLEANQNVRACRIHTSLKSLQRQGYLWYGKGIYTLTLDGIDKVAKL